MYELIDQMQIGILFENISGNIITVNPFFCDLFRIPFKPDDLIGKNSGEVVDAISHLCVKNGGYITCLKENFSGCKSITGQEIVLKDGRTIQCDYVPVISNGKLLGHVWQYRDNTQLKLRQKYCFLLRDLGFSLASSVTIENVLMLVMDKIKTIEEIDGSVIYLVNFDKGMIEHKVFTGFYQSCPEKIHEYHFVECQLKLVSDGNAVFGHWDEIFGNADLFQFEKLKQIGLIPINLKNEKLIGLLNVVSKKKDEFSNETKNALELICTKIGFTLARINVQNAFLLSQKDFQLLFESLADLSVTLDNNGIITNANSVTIERLGYSGEELKGMSVMDLYPPEKRHEAAVIVDKILKGEKNSSELPFCTKDDRLIPVVTKVFAGKSNGKNILYAISRDLSEKRYAEEKLRRSEARWQYAMESTGDGLWDWDLVTNKVYYSSQWKKMLGYEDNEISDSRDDWEKMIHPDDLKNMISRIESHLKGETPIYRSVHRILCKNGSFKWVVERGKVMSVNQAGISERIIGTTADISRMKDHENYLARALRKEKELNELKSYFVSKTSHEFRTPLSTMLIAAESLEFYFDRMTNKQREKKIKRIKSNINFLTKVIEKVLDLSHLESGKMKFEPSKIDLRKFLTDIVDECRAQPNIKHKIELIVPQSPVSISIDEQMIKQVINNIISNGRKYSPEGSTIKIELTRNNEDTLISFYDRGIGIPDKDAEKIFEPFFRGSNVGSIKGTGIGLALSRQFVRCHGGDISFIRRPEKGSIFIVTLPEADVG